MSRPANKSNVRQPNVRQSNTTPRININTESIFRDNAQVINQVRQNLDFINSSQNQITQREKSIISNERICPITQIKSLRPHLGKLNAANYKETLSKYFYDPQVMAAAACVSDSIFFVGPNDSSNVTSFERIKNFIRDLRQIGAESVDGYALSGSLLKSDDVFIVKAPRDVDNNELLHEYFIGTYGLNQLRKIVPNFAYIMGSFACSPPAINQNKEVVAWCNNNVNSVNYVLYENITPGMGLRDYIKKGCTFNQWLNIYMQVLYALQVAYEIADFTHYDLHDENVIVREIEQNTVLIPYKTEKGIQEYIQADSVATIIDFGISHIKYRGENFGVNDRIPWGVRADRGFPMHDAYKLLLWSMKTASKSNHAIFKDMVKIFRFFNKTDDPQIVVQEQSKTYFYLPNSGEQTKLTHYDLTRYIRSNIATPFILTHPNQYPTLGCSSMVCPSNSQAIQNIGMVGELKARTVFEFYDLVSNLQKNNKINEIEQIVDNFDYNKAMNVAFSEYDTLIRKINNYNKTVIYRIYSANYALNAAKLLTEETYHQFRRYVSTILQAYEDFQNITILKDAMEYTAKYFNDASFIENLNTNFAKVLAEYNNRYIRLIVPDLKQQINYIVSLYQKNPKIFDDKIKLNKRYSWFITTLPSYLNILP